MLDKYEEYYTLDEPVPYKNIFLYPIKVNEYDTFYKCAQVLTLEKNSIADINIISMSYLGYIYYLHEEIRGENKLDYLILLEILLRICIHDKESKRKIIFGCNNSGKPVFEIDSIPFTETDFEEIRDIICNQNLIIRPDERMQKDVRDKIEEVRRYKEKISGNKPASFEDNILSLVASSSMSLEEVYNMPIRKFIKLLRRIDAKLHYEIYLGAAMSGMVEFKDKSILRHWMSDLEKENKYDDVMLDLDTMTEEHNLSTK